MHFLNDYFLFFAKTFTFVIAILITIVGVIALSKKKELLIHKIKIKHLNKKFDEICTHLQQDTFSKTQLKQSKKQQKALKEQLNKKNRKKIFYIEFNGDYRAAEANELREKITAILTIAKPEDEVVIKLESGGGLVHAYGLCASQLVRLRQRNIQLTAIIDKVAASGGYLMASVANHIIAAPFAIIGSIGVLVQLPNFHRLLKEHNIDFEQLSAGEYKRTLTLFGENNDKGREKLQEEIDETHKLFKQFVTTYRPQLDIAKVATGEFWFGSQAQELQLIDKIGTSDDYLLTASEHADIYEITYKSAKSLPAKLLGAAGNIVHNKFW
jgi:serine protease SohB